MKFTRAALAVLMIAPLVGASALASASEFDSVKAKLQAAMQSDVRTDQEKGRDQNRLPIETLEFFGLRDDMRVIELMPGGGWYTKLLAPVLSDKGDFYIAIGAERVAGSLADVAGFENLKLTAADSSLNRGSQGYDLTLPSLGVADADMVFTFRNYHNFSEAGRMQMNEKVFEALKPGGIYAVVDHTRRHMEPASDDNGRRVDPVLAIMEIQSTGFEFVGYTDLHYRTADELLYEVGRPNVTGKTDRWTLKFRKPE